MLTFDPERLQQRPNGWNRFNVLNNDGISLSSDHLPGSAELIVFERNNERRALLVQEMAYHHLAQGTLAGEPYIVSFCGLCHSGVGMTPIVNGEIYHFQVGGLYDGIAILKDDETGTYWNHISGKAVYGPLAGTQLDIWSFEMTTVAAAVMQEPNLKILRSYQQRPTFRRVIHLFRRVIRFGKRKLVKVELLPKCWTCPMGSEDSRLPRMTMGLGVVVDGAARFYPVEILKIQGSIMDELANKQLEITYDQSNGVPQAIQRNDARPLQYFLRWYGFALTYPHCSVYS